MRCQVYILPLFLLGLPWTLFYANADTCPESYQRYSKDHTFCKPPSPTCKIVLNTVDKESIKTILNEHNRYRNKIAMGQETIGPLPKAKNMLQMEWDDELANIAQKHANQCKFEHDCSECRQIKNFNVGQNLYTKYSSGNLKQNWKPGIKAWYDEVADFDKNYVSSFDGNSGKGVIGHFTQVVWAESWKIGCGYVAYKEDKYNKELYVCNYGPGGNMEKQPMYEIGAPCSACPLKSCCGKTCGNTDFPGLCKLTDGSPPRYKPPADKNTLYFCNFESNKCPYVEDDKKNWKIHDVLSGSYIGTTLKGGESRRLNITKTFSSDSKQCLLIRYRKGPTIAGNKAAAKAEIQVTLTESNTVVGNVPISLNADDLNFYEFSLNMNWNGLQFKVAFDVSVPSGKPPQYFEIKDLTLSKGPCPNYV